MGCQNCILRVQWHFLRNFFRRIIINDTLSEKIQLALSELHSTFPRNFRAKQFSLIFLARFFKHGLPKLYSACPEALFAELFSQNHNNWHCERKKSAGFVPTAFYFSGELLSKQFSFSSPCQILQAWVAKTVFYVSSGIFCGIFFRRIILIGTVSEKIQLLLSQLHSTFPGNFWANNSRSCPFGFVSSPCQILQAWVAKTVFYVSRGTFCGIFLTES